jgi:hypothetical protein
MGFSIDAALGEVGRRHGFGHEPLLILTGASNG